ncbi:hypothetical protein PSTG_19667, partial [Puccinia striiformis f. sp. tritici PST-78]
MQSIVAAWLEPERVGKVVRRVLQFATPNVQVSENQIKPITSRAKQDSLSIQDHNDKRWLVPINLLVLMADPNWNNGFYYDSAPPHVGMKLARQTSTNTYRSRPGLEQ